MDQRKLCTYLWEEFIEGYIIFSNSCEEGWICPEPPLRFHGQYYSAYCEPFTTTTAYPTPPEGYCIFRWWNGTYIIDAVYCAEGYFCGSFPVQYQGNLLYSPCVSTPTTEEPSLA